MEKKIIIRANSKRDGGRCVGGICIDEDPKWNNKWIRPLYKGKAKRSIDEAEVKGINLLDVVKIHLTESESESDITGKKHPIENHFIDSKKPDNWVKIDIGKNWSEKIEYIRTFCENNKSILHADKNFFNESEMQGIMKDHWVSSMLIEKEVRFVFSEEFNRWYGNFDTQDGENIHLTLTDPDFELILENDENKRKGNYILAISLAENPSKRDGCYYKFIAGVIDPKLF